MIYFIKEFELDDYLKTILWMPAIFISGYTTDAIHKKKLLKENINFVSKPFSPQVILQKIR